MAWSDANALTRSFVYFMSNTVKEQRERLSSAGCEDFMRRYVTIMSGASKRRGEKSKNKFTAMPYFHASSHDVKACANNFSVNVVFNTDFKSDDFTPFQRQRNVCQKDYRDTSLPCEEGVVYEIPLASGFKYVGQASRCLNDRLTEHKKKTM